MSEEHRQRFKLVQAVGLNSEFTFMLWKNPLPGVWQQLYSCTIEKPEPDEWPGKLQAKFPPFTLDPANATLKDGERPKDSGWNEQMVYRVLEHGSCVDSEGWSGRVRVMTEAETFEEMVHEISIHLHDSTVVIEGASAQ